MGDFVSGNRKKGTEILEIFCSSCGAPAGYDIESGNYRCRYCGSATGIKEALENKNEYRRLIRDRVNNAAPSFRMQSAECSGCGARIVFAENEALTDCAFCGRKLVRKGYLGSKDFPELLIPFRITREEAKRRLLDWCAANKHRKEAKILKKNTEKTEGFYLPYMIVKGPDDCTVRCQNTHRAYHCRGFVEGKFVNTSNNLDNSVLDGAEPYDTTDLREFDFSYLAGQRVKIADLKHSDALDRIRDEIAADYEPCVAKTFGTKAVTVTPDIGGMMAMSAVLPAYYVSADGVIAAVNGQTGKVAVRENRERFMLPWQLKPIAVILFLIAASFLGTYLISHDTGTSAFITGVLGMFFLIVVSVAYHDDYGGSGRFRLRRRILTSDDSRPEMTEPVFYEKLDGKDRPVKLKFDTPLRTLRMATLTVIVTFLPLVIAFVLNGFSTEGLTFGGAAVWLCIFVPVAPICYFKIGRMQLHERPIIYTPDKKGKMRRYRHFPGFRKAWESFKDTFLNPVTIGLLLVALLILFINTGLVLDWDGFGKVGGDPPETVTEGNSVTAAAVHGTDESGRTLYRVDYDGCKDFYNNAKDEYRAGEKVKVYFYMVATDTDYHFELEGAELETGFDWQKGYILSFTMPDHDVKLTVTSRNSMEPDD